jgi:type II secretory pathway component PulF
MRPNPPKMVTVVLAVLLLLLGLVLIYFESDAAGFVRQLPLGADLTRQVLDWVHNRTFAFVCLAASPILLILGSLFRGL